MLAKFLVRAVFAALGLWVASEIVPGVDSRSMQKLFLRDFHFFLLLSDAERGWEVFIHLRSFCYLQLTING